MYSHNPTVSQYLQLKVLKVLLYWLPFQFVHYDATIANHHLRVFFENVSST